VRFFSHYCPEIRTNAGVLLFFFEELLEKF